MTIYAVWLEDFGSSVFRHQSDIREVVLEKNYKLSFTLTRKSSYFDHYCADSSSKWKFWYRFFCLVYPGKDAYRTSSSFFSVETLECFFFVNFVEFVMKCLVFQWRFVVFLTCEEWNLVAHLSCVNLRLDQVFSTPMSATSQPHINIHFFNYNSAILLTVFLMLFHTFVYLTIFVFNSWLDRLIWVASVNFSNQRTTAIKLFDFGLLLLLTL